MSRRTRVRSSSKGTLFVTNDDFREKVEELEKHIELVKQTSQSKSSLEVLRVDVVDEVAQMRDTCLQVARSSVTQYINDASSKLSAHVQEVEQLQQQVDARLRELEKLGSTVATAQSAWKAYSASIDDRMEFPSYVQLRVGEHVFHTSLSTIRKVQDSMLAIMFSGKFMVEQDRDGCYFIDRDGERFHYILSFLRSGQLPAEGTDRAVLEALLQDCIYFGIKPLRVKLEGRLSSSEELYEKNSMSDIKELASLHYVQAIIAQLAELTQMVFKQMAHDADAGLALTKLDFYPTDTVYSFLVEGDHPSKACQIFLELLRKEEVPIDCLMEKGMVSFQCYLLKSDDEICSAVLKNFRKMREVRP